MSDQFNFPAPPDPTKIAQWAGQIRTLVAVLAGAGVLGGIWAGVSAEQIANWLTAILTVAGLVGAAWSSIKSWEDKKTARATAVASAAASAELGRAVTVAVTPPGQANVVSEVSAAEVAAAPSAPLNVMPSPAPVAPQ